jgi:hypothetical protein
MLVKPDVRLILGVVLETGAALSRPVTLETAAATPVAPLLRRAVAARSTTFSVG